MNTQPEGTLTAWRLVLIAWTVAAVVLTMNMGWGVVSFLLVWLLGLAVIGGVRMAFQR